MSFTAGQLVEYRDRRWVVQPSPIDQPEILLLRPLGGSEAEEVGIYRSLHRQISLVGTDSFPYPSSSDLAPLDQGVLLYDANRLLFRQASGPIRCMGRLSFRPRSYQLVPLVMMLRQTERDQPLRLMIADDVGVGKTIEALMIMAEMQERRMVRSVAIVCPPQLCEQWQSEVKAKLGQDAVIVRSSTVSALERQIPESIRNTNIWKHFPVTVNSIDYLKSSSKMHQFMAALPGLVIADEVHTAALPQGATNVNQQQRHRLLGEIAGREGQHLLLLTATPHSGKDEEFKSLLGLLKPEFSQLNLARSEDKLRLAPHFIQRKRRDLRHWLEETTRFPERVHSERPFKLASSPYMDFYTQLLAYVRRLGSAAEGMAENKQRMRWWAALALLRGAMSSPAAGVEMLRRRHERLTEQAREDMLDQAGMAEQTFIQFTDGSDLEEADMVDSANLHGEDPEVLQNLLSQAEALKGPEHDPKIRKLLERVRALLKEGFRPIVFCKYIQTARYVGEQLAGANLSAEIVTVTSELGDEQRRLEIERLKPNEEATRPKSAILVATDCLSEGINLQDLFTAVIHYDLPWNPNRLEQREGRIDRFGQTAERVMVETLYGEDNQVDRKVIDIIVKKINEIQASLGTTIPLPEGKGSLIDQLFRSVIQAKEEQQLSLFEKDLETQIQQAKEKAEAIRSVFAQNKISPDDLREDLSEIDEAIGTPETVRALMTRALPQLGFQMEALRGDVYRLVDGGSSDFRTVAHEVRQLIGKRKDVRAAFESPTPAGVVYLGRNHPLVEACCQALLRLALEPNEQSQGARLGRCAVVRTAHVESATTLVMARVRNVIKASKTDTTLVAEEMYLWGYAHTPDEAEPIRILPDETSHNLLLGHMLTYTEPKDFVQKDQIERELEFLKTEPMARRLEQVTQDRCARLAASHQKFGKAIDEQYKPALQPVIPPDVIGLYILLPQV